MKKFFRKIVEMNIIKLYCVTLVFHFAWVFMIGTILHHFDVEFSQNVVSSLNFLSEELIDDIACVFLEEMLFRWGPMVLFFLSIWILCKITKIGDKPASRIRKCGIVIIVLVSSTIFGIAHGNVFNILIQGVAGVIFFMFYLRTLYREKYKGKSDIFQLRPLMSSAVYHALCNVAFSVLQIRKTVGIPTVFSRIINQKLTQ